MISARTPRKPGWAQPETSPDEPSPEIGSNTSGVVTWHAARSNRPGDTITIEPGVGVGAEVMSDRAHLTASGEDGGRIACGGATPIDLGGGSRGERVRKRPGVLVGAVDDDRRSR